MGKAGRAGWLAVVLLAMCSAMMAQAAPAASAAGASHGKGATKGTGASKGDMAGEHAAGHKMVTPDELKWQPLFPGTGSTAQMAVLLGDPGKPGPFIIRLKTGAGEKIPAHWHPGDEAITVLSGAFWIGAGDKLDESKMHEMKVGTFANVPKRMHHFGMTKQDTVIQVNGQGPFKLYFVDPNDDPMKGQKVAKGESKKGAKK